MISTSPRLSPAPVPVAPDPTPPRGRRGTTEISGTWAWTHGAPTRAPHPAWELAGPDDAPVVAVLGGISAGRHVTASTVDPSPGWWSSVAGPGRAIDTRRFRVLSLDFVGGNGGSGGPGKGRAVDTLDQARALAAVCDALSIPRVEAIVGASYGGMVALRAAAEFPERWGRVVAISAADRPHPRSTAWRSLQRRSVRWGRDAGREREGLSWSRGLAMVGYRSAEELRQRFDAPPRIVDGAWRFPIEDYLDARGADFADRFSPEAFLALSESIDLHRVDPLRISAPTTLVGVRSDELVPIGDLRRLAGVLASGRRSEADSDRSPRSESRLVEIDSLYGHDAFLKETEAVSRILRQELDREVCR